MLIFLKIVLLKTTLINLVSANEIHTDWELSVRPSRFEKQLLVHVMKNANYTIISLN